MANLSRRELLTAAGATALSSSAAPNRIIDSHVHVWKRDPRYPFAKETKRPPEEDASAEMLLDLMKANGVSKTVIIQVIHYRWDNSYLADVLKRYPQTFQGVCRVDPENPAAPDHLAELVESHRFHGVRLSPAGGAGGDWIRGPLMPPLWKRCRDLKAPMTVLAPVSRMPDIVPLIESLPDLTVVIDHQADSPLDRPEELKKLLALVRYPKVFVKISHCWSLSKQPYPYLDAQEQVKRLYDGFGPQRLMAGTDWPVVLNSHCTYQQAVTLFRDDIKFFTAEDKTWILGKTIERVWPFPG